jgi:hypothetical protein
MKCFVYSLVAAALFVGGSANRASAGPVQDQINDPGDLAGSLLFFTGQNLVQTFTAGVTGKLDEIDVRIGNHNGATEPVILELWTFSGTTLSTQIGGDHSLPASSVPSTPGFVSFDLSASAPSIIAGDHLAILLKTDSSSALAFGWQANLTPSYSAGEGFFSTDGSTLVSFFQDPTLVDFGFKTFVDPPSGDVPEPSSLLLTSILVSMFSAGWSSSRLKKLTPGNQP